MKLDIGCGLHPKHPLSEWVHLDCDEGPHIEMVTDFASIPVDDDQVDEIWIGDVIEHIPVWRQNEVLAEWKRVLRPGGVIAGTTPNLHRRMMQYARNEIDLGWLLQNLYGDRSGLPHQHYILFTPQSLTKLLEDHGFSNVDLSGSPKADHGEIEWIVFKATYNG